nr:hypothetical protein [uncultured Chryseobacterium sp.]
MKNNFISKLPMLVTILVILYSCRHNDLSEENISHNLNTSKFSFVTLKDIPEVANYIHQKTGREDFHILIHNQNKGKAFNFSTVNLSTIVKKKEGDFTYYVFGIDSQNLDEKTVYNLEIKEIRGKMESMNIIVYQSIKPYSSDPKTRFDYFTGTVSSMDTEGKAVSTVGYNDGIGDCPPPTGDGGGNPDWGTGAIGTGDIPPNGGWYDGGGGHNDEEPWTSDPSGCWDIVTDPVKPWITLGWSNHCTGQQILNVNKIAGGGYGKLTADCNGDGSGVIITDPSTPCEKIKTQREDTEFKTRFEDLQGKTGLKKEIGYIQKNSGTYEYKDNAQATDTHNSLSLPEPTTNTYIKGFLHTHIDDYTYTVENGDEIEMNGFKIFSPSDVIYFMDMIKNAKDAGSPLGEVYAMMISSGQSYQIRFTGNLNQTKVFTDAERTPLRNSYIRFMKEYKTNNKLELGFLKFIDEKMFLRGISLYRMNSDGTTTEIKLNADKTAADENNCP